MGKIGLAWRIIKIRTKYYKVRYKLALGKNTLIMGKCEFTGEGHISIGDDTRVSQWCCFKEYGGYIRIGDNCSINSFCYLSGNGGIEIGSNVRIATQCVIVSANHNFDRIDIPITLQGETPEKIIIEDDCWLGAGVKVLAGVTIGHGSVIGAGSVITHDIPPYSVVVGVPGRVLRSRNVL